MLRDPQTPQVSPAPQGPARHGAEARKRLTAILMIAVPGIVVAALLALLASIRNGIEATVANFAAALPFGYAFAAGMVASVNPCGFFMLPAYLSYQLGTTEEGFYASSAIKRGVKALGVGLTAASGFLAIIALVGYVIAAGGQRLVHAFPYAGVTIGGILAVLGVWLLLTGRSFGIEAAKRVTIAPRRSVRNVFLFGVAYAAGSLSCTLPVFLLVVGSSLATRGLAGSFGQFISYALGMGSILVAVTIGAAVFRGGVARSLRLALPYVNRISALFLTGAGLYLIYYWVRLSGSIL